MKLNIYKNQQEVAKTYEADAYDLMYGTVEDVLDILDGVSDDITDDDFLMLIRKSMPKLNHLLLDVFPGLTEEELKHVKLKELIPVFFEIFSFVKDSISFNQEKN